MRKKVEQLTRSKEWADKISLAKKGKKQPNISKAKMGHKHSEETKKKIGYKSAHRSKEVTAKISKTLTGRTIPKEVKEKISRNNSRYWLGKKRQDVSGENNYNWNGGKPKCSCGKTIGYGIRFCRSCYFKNNVNENHWNWQGGITSLPYSFDWTKTLRQSIRERDGYVCAVCGVEQDNRALCVHHIDYNKNNCNPDNLISLCLNCHIKTNYNRDYWVNYFKQIYE